MAGIICGNTTGILRYPSGRTPMAVVAIQNAIDGYLDRYDARLDFIHDFEIVVKNGRLPNNIGILMPTISKEEFFPYLIKHGALPRKSFSIGESHEKRYYIEARKIST